MSGPRLCVGIAGGTGAGKSTVARCIAEGLQDKGVLLLDSDSYYIDRSTMPLQDREALNYDHPSSLDFPLLIEHLSLLRAGRPIKKPLYDFATHVRLPQHELIYPADMIIVDGILIFVEPDLRDCFDVKIFVDTDADIRLYRRILRDTECRGRSLRSVLSQYINTVRPMHLQFVEPSKRFADLVVPWTDRKDEAIQGAVEEIRAHLDSRGRRQRRACSQKK